MELLEDIPLIIFISAFFAIFCYFIIGTAILSIAGTKPQGTERGRKIILKSLYAFLVLLLVALVFFLVTYLVKKGEALKPPPASKDFPAPPFSIFPSGPEFVEIEGYYFSGPWSLRSLKEKNIFEGSEMSGLYAILCKRNGEYDTIYIGSMGRQEPDYQCWMDNCENKIENLYLAALQTNREGLLEKIIRRVSPPCPTK